MTNDELKKKIAQIIADYFCPQRNEHKNLWGDDRLCYSKMNFAECERVTECTYALIAAGIGDVKEAELERKAYEVASNQYRIWFEEQKDRAEVAERALRNICTNIRKDSGDIDDEIKTNSNILYKAYINRAEKELAEERKDDSRGKD